ncbi:DNA-binding transcriptional LysR family regulator [Pseudomonas psychrotolerans]|nr:DNA-binding transcriptional LysR family regulator [Pseudomonas psychrotolerans]
MHYQLEHSDLTLILALSRGATLARAAQLLAQDVSSVHRALGRLEARLGLALFERGRHGCRPLPQVLPLLQAAQAAEEALLAARAELLAEEAPPSGSVRLSTTDAVLERLLIPLLDAFLARYPQIRLELTTDNAFVNLSPARSGPGPAPDREPAQPPGRPAPAAGAVPAVRHEDLSRTCRHPGRRLALAGTR